MNLVNRLSRPIFAVVAAIAVVSTVNGASAEQETFPSPAEIQAAALEGVEAGILDTGEKSAYAEQSPSSQPATSKKFIVKYKVTVGVWPILITKNVTVEIFVRDGKVIIRTTIEGEQPEEEEVKPGPHPKPSEEDIKKLKEKLEKLNKDKTENGGDIESVTKDGAKERIKEDLRRRLRDFVQSSSTDMVDPAILDMQQREEILAR